MTIKDIAKLSGVGVSTVSRVLNDRPDVSEESRRRVLEVIAEHNYLPNNSARSLVRTKSDTVGLVVRGVQNPFYTDIIRAIEHKLDLAGYTMVMRQIASGDDEVKCGAVMERDFTVESGCRAKRERLKRPADFTAVFAIADDMAIGAMRALRESGRSIPEDCSIIAIDGINVSEYIHPMLTTLCQPMTAMGTKSVELLLGVIRGGAHDHLTLPTTLRAGESVRDLTK